MELQFSKSACRCLRTVVDNVQHKEETQEIRISDGMPDIGRVVGSWGQVIVRAKEWRSDEIRVSAGVMAWVAYAPEDGSGIRCVEVWIPMQFRWDLPDSQRDGQICIQPNLAAVDARSTSSRKLIVRVTVGASVQALEADEMTLYKPDALPEDIQLLQSMYPLELPQEAGEKLFQLEEGTKLPQELVRPEKILHYELHPSVTEQKILANRLVFRGIGLLNVLYAGTDGMLHTFRHEFPFSQYTELDRDYGNNASAWITPVVTSLELTRSEDDTVTMNAGIAAQYVIFDRHMVELTEDAFSNQRVVAPVFEQLSLPVRLDSRELNAELTLQLPENAGQVAEVSWMISQPAVSRMGDVAQVQLTGQYQALYYDEEGNLQTANGKADAVTEISVDASSRLQAWPGLVVSENGSCNVSSQLMTYGAEAMVAVCGLQVGDCKKPDEGRPSLILCRTDGERLWDVAKRCGSTVGDIMAANGLSGEPQSDKMLLIPVK